MKQRIWLIVAVMALVVSGCSSHRKVAGTTKPGERMAHVVPSTPKQVKQLVAEARKWIGTPYAYGGHSRRGTDCSGFVMEIFGKVYDLKLPRSSAMQQQYSRPLKRKELQPGDLIFFATGRNGRVSHVGLYIGDNRMIHASGSKGVMEASLAQAYWTQNYHSAGRVIETDAKRREKEKPKLDTEPTEQRMQQLYDTLDSQIDSIYVTNPEIFD